MNANQFFKDTTISNIIMLADRTIGREHVAAQIQYSYKHLNKQTLEQLEQFRDNLIKEYNIKANNGTLHNF
jgi:hypothetical protein